MLFFFKQKTAYEIPLRLVGSEMCIRDRFHALATGLTRDAAGNVDALFLETKSGRCAVRGKVFIDCSGDAEIAQWGGLPFEKGDAHGHMLYPTLMFKVGNVDGARAQEAWKTIPLLMDQAAASGEFTFPRRGAIVRPQKHDYESVSYTHLRAHET